MGATGVASAGCGVDVDVSPLAVGALCAKVNVETIKVSANVQEGKVRMATALV